MGQQEVYNYLKKHKGWRTVKEIAETIKLPKGPIRRSLKMMLKYREVFCKEISVYAEGKYQGHKRKIEHWKLQ